MSCEALGICKLFSALIVKYRRLDLDFSFFDVTNQACLVIEEIIFRPRNDLFSHFPKIMEISL